MELEFCGFQEIRLDRDRSIEHWRDEGDFHCLYQALAAQQNEPEQRKFLEEMAAIERRHQQVFRGMLEATGADWL